MTSFKFYSSQPPMILALQGNDVDVIAQFTPAGAAAILNSPSYKIIKLKSANHRELSMRNDIAPFTDARVRQAVAYTLDRPGAVAALLSGDGTVANDYPFGPRYPSTDTSVPQRTQNISMAKQLLAAAGHPNGFCTTMNSEIYQEIPQLAQVIQQDAAKAGITIKLNITNQTLYYGKSTFGNSPWLDGTMSLVDYGDRGVAERVPDGAADLCRHVERGAVQEHGVRRPRQAVRGRARPRRRRRRLPARSRTCCWPGDADRLSVLDRRV